MAKNELKIDVSVTGLDVPLMIIVGEGGKVVVYQHGVKVQALRSIKFEAAIDTVPTTVMEQAVL